MSDAIMDKDIERKLEVIENLVSEGKLPEASVFIESLLLESFSQ